MNIFRWAKGYLYSRSEKSILAVLYEISILTEGLSVAVRQISDLHTQIPGNNFMARSISDGLLKRMDTFGAGVTLLVGRVANLEIAVKRIAIEIESINAYLMVPGDMKDKSNVKESQKEDGDSGSDQTT